MSEISTIRPVIEQAWEQRDEVTPRSFAPELRDALAVSLTLLTGNGVGTGAGGGGGSQQQSIVLGGGRVISQGGPIHAVCGNCQARMPDGARFCPDCGNSA